MTPLYFPHTLLDRKEVAALRSLFDQTVVYTPMQSIVPASMERWQTEGGILIRQPVTGDEDLLNRQMAAYKQWGVIHQRKGKLDTALWKLDSEHTPFFDDNATSQIKMDIKSIRSKGTSDEEGAAKDAGFDRLKARLFICMAQQFDQQTRELTDDLKACDDQTRQLMAQLKGVNAPPAAEAEPTESPAFDTPGSFMIENRIGAWCRLFIEDRTWLKTQPGPFWVTHSSEAVACIRDHCSSLETKAVLGPLTPATVTDSWKRMLKEYLTDLSDAPDTPVPDGLSKKDAAPSKTADCLHLYCIERDALIEQTARPTKLMTLIKEAQNIILDNNPLIVALISPSD